MNDPYQVLGISPDATPEEIKKAYRRKSKEYHPDLHPDDPIAAQKMAEVNEAYDMLMNPERYARYNRQQGNSDPYGQGDSSQTYHRQQESYQGPGGWASDSGGFDDFFGFGFDFENYDTQADQVFIPQVQPGDSPQIRQAISAIQNQQYQQAILILSQVVSTYRNARWYYLSSLANHGLGNTVYAVDHIRRAIQLDPNCVEYRQVLQQYQYTTQSYQQHSQEFHMDLNGMSRMCLGLCCVNYMCRMYAFGC